MLQGHSQLGAVAAGGDREVTRGTKGYYNKREDNMSDTVALLIVAVCLVISIIAASCHINDINKDMETLSQSVVDLDKEVKQLKGIVFVMAKHQGWTISEQTLIFSPTKENNNETIRH